MENAIIIRRRRRLALLIPTADGSYSMFGNARAANVDTAENSLTSIIAESSRMQGCWTALAGVKCTRLMPEPF